jgi:hypothetical protein
MTVTEMEGYGSSQSSNQVEQMYSGHWETLPVSDTIRLPPCGRCRPNGRDAAVNHSQHLLHKWSDTRRQDSNHSPYRSIVPKIINVH